MYFCTDKALFEKSKTEKSDEICKLANRNPTERNINVNYSTSAHNLVSSSFKVEKGNLEYQLFYAEDGALLQQRDVSGDKDDTHWPIDKKVAE